MRASLQNLKIGKIDDDEEEGDDIDDDDDDNDSDGDGKVDNSCI